MQIYSPLWKSWSFSRILSFYVKWLCQVVVINGAESYHGSKIRKDCQKEVEEFEILLSSLSGCFGEDKAEAFRQMTSISWKVGQSKCRFLHSDRKIFPRSSSLERVHNSSFAPSTMWASWSYQETVWSQNFISKKPGNFEFYLHTFVTGSLKVIQ